MEWILKFSLLRSRFECSSFCLSNPRCTGVYWDNSTLKCQSLSALNLVGDSTISAVVVYIDREKQPGILQNIHLSFPKIFTIRNVLYFGWGNSAKKWIKALKIC